MRVWVKERVYREIDVGIFTVAIISGGEGGAGVCARLLVENQTDPAFFREAIFVAEERRISRMNESDWKGVLIS